MCCTNSALQLRGKLRLRQAEFARACVKMILETPEKPCAVRYVGFLRQEQFADLNPFVSSAIFKHWDASPNSPPRSRPAESAPAAAPALNLKVLCFQDGAPIWPDGILSRFPSETEENQQILALHKKFSEEFPARVAGTRDVQNRIQGGCDYAIEGGARPPDTTRVVELRSIPMSDFNVERRRAAIVTLAFSFRVYILAY